MNNMVSNNRIIAAAIFFFAHICSNELMAQTETSDEANKVLERFIGTWEKKVTRNPTINDDQQTQFTGKQVNKWVLDKAHMHESGTDSDGMKYISMFSYDANLKKIRIVSFQNNGFSNHMVAQWDAESQCLTGTGSVGDGLTLTTKHQFTSDDTMNVSVVVTDSQDNKLFDISVQARRTSK